MAGIADILKGAGDFAKDAINVAKDIYNDVKDFGKSDDGTQAQTGTGQQQTQTGSGLTLGDFSFTPNWGLLIGGFLLLIIALAMLRK
jgi:hypothetical protein